MNPWTQICCRIVRRNLGSDHVVGRTDGGSASGGADLYLIVASRQDATLATVHEWVQSDTVPVWADCAGFPRNCAVGVYKLAICPLIRTDDYGGSQLVVPHKERQDMIRRFHDSLFAGHLGVSRTVFRLQSQMYWPGLRQDVRTYLASCTVCLARKYPCPRRAPMGHVAVGRRWDRVAMNLLDMSVASAKGNRYVLVMASDGGLFRLLEEISI